MTTPRDTWAYKTCPQCKQPSTMLRSLGYCGHCNHRCDQNCDHATTGTAT